MKLKKKKKSKGLRGTHTHGRGFKKKARGSGHQGGVGMAGTGKRGDQKKTLILNLYGNDYFGKSKTLRVGKPRKKLNSINLGDIQLILNTLLKKGKAKESKSGLEINLQGYKILGSGDFSLKAAIHA